jgi:C-terminal processing protease CtpA/Prc
VPHGRIWLSRESFKKQRRRKNETGLTLAYVMNEGERELRVKQIRKNSRSQELYRLGLRPGMLITKIDDKDPADIDLWEVNQRLSGDFDTFVSLSWMTKKGIKVAPLKVRE